MSQAQMQPSLNAYRRRIVAMVRSMLHPYSPFARALDFGSGDGVFAEVLRNEQVAREIVPVDVQWRDSALVQPVLYDGQRLPFEDRSFELVYTIDVLHHCRDPRTSLQELLRCSSGYALIKDHNYQSWVGKLTLCILDELGNRRFGVPSVYNYQRSWEWSGCFEEAGFTLDRLIRSAPCHAGLLGRCTNHLQYMGLWRRKQG